MTSPFILSQQHIAHLREAALMWIIWLLGVITRIGPLSRARRLRRFVAEYERFAERLVFVLAARRLYRPSRKVLRHASVQRGFRHKRVSRRLLFKSARIRAKGADLWVRIQRVRDVLTDPERYVIAFMRKLRRGLRRFRIVLTAPASDALGPTRAQASAYANSS